MNHVWHAFHETRRRKNPLSEGSKSCISTEMKRILWSGQRYTNGVSDRLQIDETFRTACQKKKQRTWLIFTACHIFERFRNFCSYCDDRKVHELFLTECLYNYFLAALGYVSCSNQIVALRYVSHTNHITTFWYHAPIIAFGYCFLVNNVMESGGFA